MADREKILIWLEKCHGVCNENTDCDLCPFSEAGTYDYSCAEQLKNAIRRELMKEQGPLAVNDANELKSFLSTAICKAFDNIAIIRGTGKTPVVLLPLDVAIGILDMLKDQLPEPPKEAEQG